MVQHLNETNYPTDTALDSGPSGIDGSVTGATSVKGEFDGSSSFDGVDDVIEFSGSAVDNNFPEGNSGNPFTFVCWTKLDSDVTGNAPTGGGLFYYNDNSGSGGDGYFFGYEGSGSGSTTNDNSLILRTSGGNTGDINFTASSNTQFLTAFVWNPGTEATIYLDLQNETDFISDTSTVVDGTTAELGAKGHADGHLSGSIDSARIFTGEKDFDWFQAEFDSSPKGGQTFFSQSTANFAGTKLTGNVTVNGTAQSGVQVNVVDKTNSKLFETTTDSNGDWSVPSTTGKLYQVSYFSDDGTTFLADAEETDTT